METSTETTDTRPPSEIPTEELLDELRREAPRIVALSALRDRKLDRRRAVWLALRQREDQVVYEVIGEASGISGSKVNAAVQTMLKKEEASS